jgi:hypothetical protein
VPLWIIWHLLNNGSGTEYALNDNALSGITESIVMGVKQEKAYH